MTSESDMEFLEELTEIKRNIRNKQQYLGKLFFIKKICNNPNTSKAYKEHNKKISLELLMHAHKRFEKWTTKDKEYIKNTMHQKVKFVAKDLGRSMDAVTGERYKIRKNILKTT